MELLKVGQSWSFQAPVPTNGNSWTGIPGVPGMTVPSRGRAGVPTGIPLVCRDFLRGLWSCRPGFLCSCTLPGNFPLSLYLWPLPLTLSFLSSLLSSISGSKFIHLISGDGFCLLKNTSLFFPCKGSHPGAHLCFPQGPSPL